MVTPPRSLTTKAPEKCDRWKTIRLPIGASCSALGRLETPPLASQPFNQPTRRCQHLPGECDEWHWTFSALRWPKTIQNNRGRDVCGLHFLSADLLLTTQWEGSLFKKGTNKNWFQKLFWGGCSFYLSHIIRICFCWSIWLVLFLVSKMVSRHTYCLMNMNEQKLVWSTECCTFGTFAHSYVVVRVHGRITNRTIPIAATALS